MTWSTKPMSPRSAKWEVLEDEDDGGGGREALEERPPGGEELGRAGPPSETEELE
jgi:hypothetical protein